MRELEGNDPRVYAGINFLRDKITFRSVRSNLQRFEQQHPQWTAIIDQADTALHLLCPDRTQGFNLRNHLILVDTNELLRLAEIGPESIKDASSQENNSPRGFVDDLNKTIYVDYESETTHDGPQVAGTLERWDPYRGWVNYLPADVVKCGIVVHEGLHLLSRGKSRVQGEKLIYQTGITEAELVDIGAMAESRYLRWGGINEQITHVLSFLALQKVGLGAYINWEYFLEKDMFKAFEAVLGESYPEELIRIYFNHLGAEFVHRAREAVGNDYLNARFIGNTGYRSPLLTKKRGHEA